MNNILAIGTNGIQNKQNKIDTIAHNIANINTIGFKKQDINFADIYNQSINSSPNSTQTNYNQGTLTETDRDLDFAILGPGFFQVADEQGNIFYTRDGSFSVNQDGYLVNSMGYRLMGSTDMGSGGEFISFPEQYQKVMLGEEGSLQVWDMNDQVYQFEIGLANIPTPSDALELVGDNLLQYRNQYNNLLEEDMIGKPGENGLGTLQQNCLEGSNVNLADQVAQLIGVHRSFSLSSRLITSVDDVWSMANNLKK